MPLGADGASVYLDATCSLLTMRLRSSVRLKQQAVAPAGRSAETFLAERPSAAGIVCHLRACHWPVSLVYFGSDLPIADCELWWPQARVPGRPHPVFRVLAHLVRMVFRTYLSRSTGPVPKGFSRAPSL